MSLRIKSTDSNRAARLKLLYITPAAILVFPFFVVVRAFEAVGEYSHDILADSRRAWNHQPPQATSVEADDE